MDPRVIIPAMPSLVSLDIETTGLDARSDAIIEIGAVRFNGRRIEEEWSTLLNPNRPIPPFIAQLTGISNEMVRNAPTLRAVLQDLVDFVGDSPIVGHSVGFDLGFLARYNALTSNYPIDTYELAAVLMPTATRYNLGSLGQALGIPLPATHRALDDARVAQAVYNQLYEQAMELPVELMAEFVRLSEPFDWGAAGCSSRYCARASASRVQPPPGARCQPRPVVRQPGRGDPAAAGTGGHTGAAEYG